MTGTDRARLRSRSQPRTVQWAQPVSTDATQPGRGRLWPSSPSSTRGVYRAPWDPNTGHSSAGPGPSSSQASASAGASSQASSLRQPQILKAPDQQQLSVFDDFEPSAAEKALARVIFEVTESGDPDKDASSILLGERAVPLFETSGLPSVLLGEIWNVCDELRGGFLTLQGLCLALRLMAHAQKHMEDGKPFPAEKEDLVRLDWFTPTTEKVYLEALADAPRARPLPPPVFAPPKNGYAPAPAQLSYLPPPGPPPGQAGDQHRRSVSAPNMPDGANIPRASTPHHDYLALETAAAEKPAFLIRTPSLSQHRASASTSSLVVPSPSFPMSQTHSSPATPIPRSPSFTPSPSFQRPATFASTSSSSTFIHAPTGPVDPFVDPTPLPPLADAQKAKYLKLWAAAGGPPPPTGTLDGETCRATFVKSRLGFAVLGRVWSLATGDAPEDTPMHAHQFVLAMYLIELLMSRALAPDKLPARLPESLIVSAGGPRTDPHALGRAAFRRPSPSPGRSEQDEADAARAFARLDSQGAGKLDGGVLLAYFMKSGLSVEVLAEIWDEADVNKDGWLTTVEFARAFQMVRARVPTFDAGAPPPPPEPSLIAFDGESLAARNRQSIVAGPSLLDAAESSSDEEDERERELPPLPTFEDDRDRGRRQMSLPPPPLPPREPSLSLPAAAQQVPLPPSPAALVPQMTGMTIAMSEPPPAYTPEVGAGERPVDVDERGVVTPGPTGR